MSRPGVDHAGRRRTLGGTRTRVVMTLLLVGTASGSVASAAANAWPVARLLAVCFLAVEVIWSVPRWRRLAQERAMRRQLAVLQTQTRVGIAVLVLHAVADGCRYPATVADRVGVADVEADPNRLHRAGLTVEWEERPGQPTRRGYQLTRAGRIVLSNTLHP